MFVGIRLAEVEEVKIRHMIRFMDKEVICLQLESYDRDKMFRYFLNIKNCGRKGMGEIALIYDGEEYVGLATYSSVLNRKGENGILIGKYVMLHSEDLFCGLNHIFREKEGEMEYIPVFDKNGQLLYFAYEYEELSIEAMERNVLPLLEAGKALPIRDLYPGIEKICIYDFNEWAYRFYKILKARNFQVEVFGEKWATLFPKVYQEDRIKFGEVLAERIMNIYAEGKNALLDESYPDSGYKLNICDAWGMVFDIAEAMLLSEYDRLKKDLRKKRAMVLTMIFPDIRRIGFRTADEFYRNKIGLLLERGDLNGSDPMVVRQVDKCWDKEGENKFQDAMAVGKRWKKRGIMVGNESVFYECYGKGRHSLYLIGPCVVEGIGVDREDSLGACVCREIEKIPGGGVCGKVFGDNWF